MKKVIGIIFTILLTIILVGCREEETKVTATFSEVDIMQNSISFDLDIQDPDQEITGEVYISLIKSNGEVVQTLDIDMEMDLTGVPFSNLVNTESYTIKVYATVGRKVHIIGEYTFQPASAQTVHITTPEQFLAMSSNRSGNYVLDNDIDFTGIEFVSPFTSAFSGTFDGQGHSIKNVTFTKVATYTGIFGYVSSAKIQNLVIENVTIGTPSAPLVMTTSTRTGILAGYISTSTAVVENVTIKNSSINYSTSSTVQAYVGGAVGEFRAKMTGIELDNVSVHLKSTSYGRIRLGGVIGTLSEEATLKEVSSNANVSLDFVGNNIRNREIRINVGGVIGYHNARNINRSVENIYSTGNVTVDLNFGTASNTTSGNYSVYVGGLAGIAYSNIHHAFYAGSIEVNHEKNDYESQVSKSFHIGGLMGFYGSNKTSTEVVRLGDNQSITIEVSDDVLLRASQTSGHSISTTIQNIGIFGSTHLMINQVSEVENDTSTVYNDLNDYFTSDWIQDAYEALTA
ncbi:ZmpA/ZmpB/ZmpC family metallo-endopeptidase-related protein [Peloplasma aerotolerans]|uniref:GLUG domain-containing protein n=1 Tax=Peloplasma aerotolerans TaxID=3044389 RepID=A0AAW6U6Z7_9MOLU|nr:ZmpA/ZmpB/ZmpC family metallo-endopeptidase-related protein [Mariniplasma sp. M4Ah]MDI6453741.1 hypothetical protein [Mariniplasma sp. M4Ah]